MELLELGDALEPLNDISVSWLFQMVFFSQREGCCRRVEGYRLMRMFIEQDTTRLLFSEGMQCGFLSRYVFGVTHSFLLEWISKNEEVRLNRWWCQIEIDSGWKHVCFGFSAWDSVVVCFGFSGHMRGKQMGLQGITVA
ncbi:hypothetical protein YC2023_100079 [Brassica napus]